MRAVPLHDDEVQATAGQLRRLIEEQRPQWTGRAVTPLPDARKGTDHVLFRIGDDLAARMPRFPGAPEPPAVGL